MNKKNTKESWPTKHKLVVFIVALVLLVGAILIIGNVVKAPSHKGGSRLSVKGELVCLPHKDADGPHTLECAYGFKADSGMYYALKEKDPDHPIFADKELKKAVTIEGIFEPEKSDVYQQEGVITVDKMSD